MGFFTEPLLWGIISLLIFLLFALIYKIRLLQKSADEIRVAFAERLSSDTNTLIDIASRDRHMCALAESINGQLRLLRSERHRFIQGDQAVKEAITNISHDLRTPLTAICGYLDLLKHEGTSETVTRCLAVIGERTESLKRLTEELLLYSVAASAGQDTVYGEVVLGQALEESILAHYAVLKGCRIVPEISMPEEKIICRLDKHALSRIFGNIISNAIKYSDGDLSITLTAQGEITFANHAQKLNEVEVQKLFDRLYTVETGGQSTGLGLSIAKTLTEQMHGAIGARYADGTLFIRLQFPIMKIGSGPDIKSEFP